MGIILEGHVPQGVGVQVPPSALILELQQAMWLQAPEEEEGEVVTRHMVGWSGG
jgi:hypothetical protein